MRLSTRLRYSVISRTSQSPALSTSAWSAAATIAGSPLERNTQVPISCSFSRSSMIASSSSRASASGQKAAPRAWIPAASAGGAASGAEIVMVAVPSPRSISMLTWR